MVGVLIYSNTHKGTTMSLKDVLAAKAASAESEVKPEEGLKENAPELDTSLVNAEALAKTLEAQAALEQPAALQDAETGFTEKVLGASKSFGANPGVAPISTGLGNSQSLDAIMAQMDSITAPYEPKAGDYKNIRLHSLTMSHGKRYYPNRFGYYEVEGLPAEAIDQLEYFAAAGKAEKVV